jgi:hypothetical protein
MRKLEKPEFLKVINASANIFLNRFNGILLGLLYSFRLVKGRGLLTFRYALPVILIFVTTFSIMGLLTTLSLDNFPDSFSMLYVCQGMGLVLCAFAGAYINIYWTLLFLNYEGYELPVLNNLESADPAILPENSHEAV